MNAVTQITKPPVSAIRTAQREFSDTSLAVIPLAKMSLSTLMSQPNRSELRDQADRVILANTPATDAEVGKVIFSLLIMYESFDRRGEHSKAMVVDQWRKSLTGWPVDILEVAAQSWINGEKASFTPQPGDIVTVCERIGAFRRAMAKKAVDFMEATA